MQFQGVFPPEGMYDLLELGDDYFDSEQLECYGYVNFMNEGIIVSNQFTAVSLMYIEELQYEFIDN